MKYINLGCGAIYSNKEEWTNLDFIAHSEHVIAHNLLNGIPYPDNTFDLVYHSHVLEHFNKKDGEAFLKECFRVLKPEGIIRIAIPDLLNIIHEYMKITNELENNINNKTLQEKYEWILLELFDQIVRTENGGEMGKFLIRKNLSILDYIEERIGYEAKAYRNWKMNQKIPKTKINTQKNSVIKSIKKRIKTFFNINQDSNIKMNNFRETGEIHQWMYDKYSCKILLEKIGFKSIRIQNGFDSYIQNWEIYHLDTENDKIRKPDSLYIEAIKS